MQTQSTKNRQSSNELPTIAAIVTHEVEDFPAWKRAFDAHAETRRKAGIFVTHINHSVDNPNLLTVYLGARNAEKLRAFLSSSDLKSTMKDAGVKGAPQIALVTPSEEMTQRRNLAGAVVMHRVGDFEAWKEAFDAHGTSRARAGILGHAVNRSVDDPNLVIVYLQAESIDDLQEFATSADLKAVMKGATVQGSPDVRYVHGEGWES